MNITPSNPKKTLGRAAFICFPEFGLSSVPAKTDTGAYRSAVHAKNIEVKEVNGVQILAYDVLLGHMSAGQSAHVETETFRQVDIENSFGHRELRYEVMVLCQLGGKRFRSSFTLADRSKKTYPVLMGRRLLNNRFLVDTTIADINRKLLKEQFNVELPKDEEEVK